MDISDVAYRLVATGRVQGVGYRAWACETARRLGLRGWVRNRTDGTVEALAGGPEADVQSFIAACRQGPRTALVRDVKAIPADAADLPGYFAQRPTET